MPLLLECTSYLQHPISRLGVISPFTRTTVVKEVVFQSNPMLHNFYVFLWNFYLQKDCWFLITELNICAYNCFAQKSKYDSFWIVFWFLCETLSLSFALQLLTKLIVLDNDIHSFVSQGITHLSLSVCIWLDSNQYSFVSQGNAFGNDQICIFDSFHNTLLVDNISCQLNFSVFYVYNVYI